MIHSRDPRSRRAVKLLRASVLGVIWLCLVLFLMPIGIYVLPDIEAAWYPPIKKQRIEDVHYSHDGRYLLWDWSFIKQRKAYPEFITFMAYRASDPIVRWAVDTYVGWDCSRNLRSDRTSLPGPQLITRKLCIRLPDELMGKPDIRIEGVFDFNVGHSFYTVPVKVPPNTLDPSAAPSIPAPLAAPK